MTPRQLELAAAIEAAFAGVELGEDVSLRQTAVLDAYGGEAELEAARRLDETRDWRRLLTDPALAEMVCDLGLCFLDAEGLRFYLPACLTLVVAHPGGALVGHATQNLLFRLTDMGRSGLEMLPMLNPAQRRCVRDVLLHLRGVYDPGDLALAAAIDGAINRYWNAGG